MKRVLARFNDKGVNHFQRGGQHAFGDDVRYRLCGLIYRLENGQQGTHGLRQGRQANSDFGDQAHRAFGADDKAHQIVTRRVFCLAAQTDDLAVRQHHRHARNMIGGDAVFQRVRPAGVFGHIAAYGARALTGRIGRVVQMVFLDGFGQVHVDDARLRGHAAVGDIGFQNLVQV